MSQDATQSPADWHDMSRFAALGRHDSRCADDTRPTVIALRRIWAGSDYSGLRKLATADSVSVPVGRRADMLHRLTGSATMTRCRSAPERVDLGAAP